MLKVITAREIRDRLGEYLDRAHPSEEGFLITRKGPAKAVLLPVDQYLKLMDRLEAFESGKKVPPETDHQSAPVLTKEQIRSISK